MKPTMIETIQDCKDMLPYVSNDASEVIEFLLNYIDEALDCCNGCNFESENEVLKHTIEELELEIKQLNRGVGC